MFEEQPRSSGVLSPIIEVRIADLDGAALPVGQSGEIWLRGVTLMERYCGDEEATAKAMQGAGSTPET